MSTAKFLHHRQCSKVQNEAILITTTNGGINCGIGNVFQSTIHSIKNMKSGQKMVCMQIGRHPGTPLKVYEENSQIYLEMKGRNDDESNW